MARRHRRHLIAAESGIAYLTSFRREARCHHLRAIFDGGFANQRWRQAWPRWGDAFHTAAIYHFHEGRRGREAGTSPASRREEMR